MQQGKTLLRVDLTTGKLKWQSTEPYREWIGGIGVGTKILYDEVKPWMGPFDPGNKVIISTGVLTGSFCPGAGRIAAVTKSPMTMGIASTNAGGAFAHALRYAGLEHIVLEGHSNKPVYLWIDDGQIEIRDASELVGKDVWETDDLLKNVHGDDINTLAIGQAGENIVRFACMTVDRHRTCGRNGFGAVLGSKNFKAIAVRGTGSVSISEKKLFFDTVDDIYRRLEETPGMRSFIEYGAMACAPGKYKHGGYNYRHSQDLNISQEMADEFAPSNIAEKYRVVQTSCYGCTIGCQNQYKITEGPYAGLVMEGTQFNSALNFGSKMDISDFGFCIKATALCNYYGMDIDVVAEQIAWAMECVEKGLMSSSDFDGLTPVFGDQDIALKLIEMMAFREGAGAKLADGVARAATYFNEDTKYYAMHLKGNDLYEVLRSIIGYGLGAVTSTRGGSHVLGSPLCETGDITDHEFAEKKFGIKTYNQPLEYNGKPELVMHYEIMTRMCSCMGTCVFSSDWQEIHMMDFEDMAKLYTATTGIPISVEKFKNQMLALLALEKIFNYTHAGFTRKDDYPPKRLMIEPVKSGSAKGSVLDIERWDKLLDNYYDVHGWERSTGIPTADTLRKLGLEYAIKDLEKLARAPGHSYL